jgi:hypothetical protein
MGGRTEVPFEVSEPLKGQDQMSATAMMVDERTHEAPRSIGLHGWGMIAWSAAGGIGLGGILVAVMTMNGQISGMGLFATASGLFLIGAVLGLAHALVLGYLGRPEGVSAQQAVRDLGRGALYAVVALPFAWIVTMWIALSMPVMYLGRIGAQVGVGLGWVAGAAVVAAAGVAGWRMLRNAYAHWPEHRVGTVLVGVTFASLLVLFLMDRPEIWGLHLRVNQTGAVLLAAVATLWVAGPIITLGLSLVQRLPGRHPVPSLVPTWRVARDLGLGLTVGAALGLIAAPFIIPAAVPGLAAAGSGGAVLAAVGQALVDEVLLRLFLVTGVAWLLLRWGRVSAGEAAVGAIAVAALVQVLLYAPGVVGLGFATTLAAVAFIVFMVLLPALVFGLLYWTRGLGAAVAADAAALVVLAMLAV